MSTQHHILPEDPKPITESSSAISALQQEVRNESANGFSSLSPATTKFYPSATAKYEQLAQSSDLFWEKLKDFHSSFETKFMIPTVGGKALDLYCLFLEVTSRGGLEKVIRDRKWKEVIMVFNFPSTITSASFVIRKYYLSLLYHFEQVYYFHKRVPSFLTHGIGNMVLGSFAVLSKIFSMIDGSVILFPDTVSRNFVDGSGTPEEGDFTNQLPASLELQPGCWVTGAIDGKFDNGYLVTVELGCDNLKGVLYHIPRGVTQTGYSLEMQSRRNRKRSRLALRDPSRPKSNRSGYNFFFAEHYGRLKPMYHGQEKAISKRIGLLWSNLTEAEKQVYQEKGLRDKERYRSEMLEYKSSYNSTT